MRLLSSSQLRLSEDLVEDDATAAPVAAAPTIVSANTNKYGDEEVVEEEVEIISFLIDILLMNAQLSAVAAASVYAKLSKEALIAALMKKDQGSFDSDFSFINNNAL